MGQAVGAVQTSRMASHTFWMIEAGIVGAVIVALWLLLRMIADAI